MGKLRYYYDSTISMCLVLKFLGIIVALSWSKGIAIEVERTSKGIEGFRLVKHVQRSALQ